MKIETPTVNLAKIRKTALPPEHASALNLKPGEVSQVITDTSGNHYIYKMNNKETLALEQVKTEIQNALQGQRVREAMEKYQSSYKVDANEAYFGAAGPGGPGMPPRAMRPQMAPPATSAPQGPGPTQPQPPAQKQN